MKVLDISVTITVSGKQSGIVVHAGTGMKRPKFKFPVRHEACWVISVQAQFLIFTHLTQSCWETVQAALNSLNDMMGHLQLNEYTLYLHPHIVLYALQYL